MKAQFSEDKIQMANNHMKRVHLHQKSGKLKLKQNTISHQSYWENFKNLTIPSIKNNVEQQQKPHKLLSWVDITRHKHSGKQCGKIW